MSKKVLILGSISAIMGAFFAKTLTDADVLLLNTAANFGGNLWGYEYEMDCILTLVRIFFKKVN